MVAIEDQYQSVVLTAHEQNGDHNHDRTDKGSDLSSIDPASHTMIYWRNECRKLSEDLKQTKQRLLDMSSAAAARDVKSHSEIDAKNELLRSKDQKIALLQKQLNAACSPQQALQTGDSYVDDYRNIICQKNAEINQLRVELLELQSTKHVYTPLTSTSASASSKSSKLSDFGPRLDETAKKVEQLGLEWRNKMSDMQSQHQQNVANLLSRAQSLTLASQSSSTPLETPVRPHKNINAAQINSITSSTNFSNGSDILNGTINKHEHTSRLSETQGIASENETDKELTGLYEQIVDLNQIIVELNQAKDAATRTIAQQNNALIVLAEKEVNYVEDLRKKNALITDMQTELEKLQSENNVLMQNPLAREAWWRLQKEKEERQADKLSREARQLEREREMEKERAADKEREHQRLILLQEKKLQLQKEKDLALQTAPVDIAMSSLVVRAEVASVLTFLKQSSERKNQGQSHTPLDVSALIKTPELTAHEKQATQFLTPTQVVKVLQSCATDLSTVRQLLSNAVAEAVANTCHMQ
jgi:hypothetical protein